MLSTFLYHIPIFIPRQYDFVLNLWITICIEYPYKYEKNTGAFLGRCLSFSWARFRGMFKRLGAVPVVYAVAARLAPFHLPVVLPVYAEDRALAEDGCAVVFADPSARVAVIKQGLWFSFHCVGGVGRSKRFGIPFM